MDPLDELAMKCLHLMRIASKEKQVIPDVTPEDACALFTKSLQSMMNLSLKEWNQLAYKCENMYHDYTTEQRELYALRLRNLVEFVKLFTA